MVVIRHRVNVIGVEVWEAGAAGKLRKWSGLVMAVMALLVGTVIMPVY